MTCCGVRVAKHSVYGMNGDQYLGNDRRSYVYLLYTVDMISIPYILII